MSSVIISKTVYEMLRCTVGSHPPESGAILGAPDAHPGRIDRVWFDCTAGWKNSEYVPTGVEIVSVVEGWMREGRHFAGVVHSHIPKLPVLSARDIQSGLEIMAANHLDSLYLGLFCNGELSMFEIRLSDDVSNCHVVKVECVIEQTPY